MFQILKPVTTACSVEKSTPTPHQKTLPPSSSTPTYQPHHSLKVQLRDANTIHPVCLLLSWCFSDHNSSTSGSGSFSLQLLLPSGEKQQLINEYGCLIGSHFPYKLLNASIERYFRHVQPWRRPQPDPGHTGP